MPKSSSKRFNKLAAWVRKIVHVGLYLILLTPLFTWSESLAPFVTARVLGFQILVEIVAAGTLILIALKIPGQERRTNPLLSPVFVALTGFLGYSLISAFVGADLNRSLWGFVDRQDGLVLLWHFLAWAGTLAWFYRVEGSDSGEAGTMLSGKRSFRTYLCFSFLVSVLVALVSLHGTGAKLDGISSWIVQVFSSTARPGSVFGNPIALGPYLVFHFFYGLYLLRAFLKSKESGSAARSVLKYAPFAGVLLSETLLLIAVLAGQTRGVIFGLVAGLFLYSILMVSGLSVARSIRVAGAAVTVCLVIGVILIWQFRDSGLVARIPVLQRMTHISAAENRTTVERLLSWGSAIKGFWDHPLLGWGYDNIYYPLNKYYDPRHIQTSPFLRDTSDTWYDKSHSFFLDLLVERGIVGVLAYLILLGVIARSLWRMPDRRLAMCLAGALAAYLVANAVAFDSFGTLFGFFLTAACLSALSDSEPVARLRSLLARDRTTDKSKRKQPAPQTQRSPLIKILMVLLVLAVGLYLNVEMAIADHKCFQARAAFAQDPAIGVSLYMDAFEHFFPYSAKEKLNCAYLIVNSVINKREASQSIETGVLVMRLTAEAVAAHPQDGAFYLVLNDLYNGLALYVNREFSRQAEAFGLKALELSPNRQEAMYQLGRTYVIRNEAGRAVELNRRMIQNADFPLGHWFLGLSLLQDNQREEAKREIRKAIDMGYQLTAADASTLKGLLGEKEFAELTAGK